MEKEQKEKDVLINVKTGTGPEPENTYSTGWMGTFLNGLSWLLLWFPLAWFFMFKTVKDYERALIFRLGKYIGKLSGPGLFFVNPFLDDVRIVDLRTRTMNLQPQSMMTKDSVTVTVDAVCYIKVENPVKSVMNVENYFSASSFLAATTLRSAVGTFELDELLSKREELNRHIKNSIQGTTDEWGVNVTQVEIKDVTLPPDMQRSMARASEAERERRAKVIAALGEYEAAEKISAAAKILDESPGSMQLRYLDTLSNIATEQNSTVIFPLPMELMKAFIQRA